MNDFLSSGLGQAPRPPGRWSAAEVRLTAAGVPEAALPYAAETLRGFEALKHAVSLLAGLLVLDLVGVERTVRDRSIAVQAAEILEEADAAVLHAAVPPSMAHHHHHLCRALALAREAEEMVARAPARIGQAGRETIVATLKAAWVELGHAARLLQGFELVDISSSCCGFHARQRVALAGRG